MDLLDYVKANGDLDTLPSGLHAVVPAHPVVVLKSGAIFALRLHPYYLISSTRPGEAVIGHTEVKRLL